MCALYILHDVTSRPHAVLIITLQLSIHNVHVTDIHTNVDNSTPDLQVCRTCQIPSECMLTLLLDMALVCSYN
jgi:hypothetical protein